MIKIFYNIIWCNFYLVLGELKVWPILFLPKKLNSDLVWFCLVIGGLVLPPDLHLGDYQHLFSLNIYLVVPFLMLVFGFYIHSALSIVAATLLFWSLNFLVVMLIASSWENMSLVFFFFWQFEFLISRWKIKLLYFGWLVK